MLKYPILFPLILTFLTISALTGYFWHSKKDSPSRKTTIVFFNSESLPEQVQMVREIIRGFEEENPEIKVNYINGDSIQKIKIRMAAGTPPDVFLWWDDIAELVKKDQLVCLNQLILKNGIDMEQYWKCLRDAYTYDGRIYAMPVQLKTTAVIYNKELLTGAMDQPPGEDWTWNDFARIATAIGKKRDSHGIVKQYGCILPDVTTFLIMNGIRPVDEIKRTCDLGSDKRCLEALRFLLSLKDQCEPSQGEWEGINGGGGSQGFRSGRVALFVAPAWVLPAFRASLPFDWGVVPVPTGLDGKRHDTFNGAGLAIHKDCTNTEAAFKFISYYTGPKGMAVFSKYRNGIPAYKKFAYSDFLAPPDQKLKPYVDAGERADSFTGFKHIINGPLITSLLNDGWAELVENHEDPAKSLPEISRKIEETLAEEEP